jgi:hypothetical protein
LAEVLKREQASLEWALQRVEEARSKDEAEIKKAEATVAMYDSNLAKMRQLPTLRRPAISP